MVFGMYVEFVDATPKSEITTVSASVERAPLEYTHNERVMTIEWVSDTKSVREVLDRQMELQPDSGILMGLSLKVNQRCIVYAFEPEYEGDRAMTILGHEVLHCFRGTFD